MAIGGFITAGPRKAAIKGAQNKMLGLDEALMFIKYMSSKEKNAAIRKAYVIATKQYRIALKSATPVSKYPDNPNWSTKKKHLKKTIGLAYSKKHKNDSKLVSPLWVGHLVRRGAYHQALVVRGTKAWNQGMGVLKNGKTRQPFFTYKSKGGSWVKGYSKKAVRGKNYVQKTVDQKEASILNGWVDSFTKGMNKEARSPKYKGYLSY